MLSDEEVFEKISDHWNEITTNEKSEVATLLNDNRYYMSRLGLSNNIFTLFIDGYIKKKDELSLKDKVEVLEEKNDEQRETIRRQVETYDKIHDSLRKEREKNLSIGKKYIELEKKYDQLVELLNKHRFYNLEIEIEEEI